MLNLVPNASSINDKKRKRDETNNQHQHATNFNPNGHPNPAKKRKTNNHIQSTMISSSNSHSNTPSYRHSNGHIIKNKHHIQPTTDEESIKFGQMSAELTYSNTSTSSLSQFPFTIPSRHQSNVNTNNFQSISNQIQYQQSAPITTNNSALLHNMNHLQSAHHDWSQSVDQSNNNRNSNIQHHHHHNHNNNSYHHQQSSQQPFLSNASSSSASTNSSIASTPQFIDMDSNHNHNNSNSNVHNHNKPAPSKKRRKHSHHHHHKHKERDNHNHHHNNNNNKSNQQTQCKSSKSKQRSIDDMVAAQLMDGIEDDMGLPIHILATVKEELLKEDPMHFQLFLQAMSLTTIGIIKPDQFVNMLSPLFVKNKKLKLLLNQLRSILHIPLHYFHSTPLYAPFLSDLSTSDKNMNLSLRSNAEQYSQICDLNVLGNKVRMNPSSSSSPTNINKKRPLSPNRNNNNNNNNNSNSNRSGTISAKSVSVSQKMNAAMMDSVSYRRNPHYKKNMICSAKEHFHLKLVNDEYVSRSTGAENNPENDHNLNRNKHEIELNEKEGIMTLWDYYVEQNGHAIQCLKRLESRILYLYKEYKKIFIIRDDYDSMDDNNNNKKNDDDKDTIVDETNLNFYDSDTYTTATEDLNRNSDSDASIDDDAMSTTSEPFLPSKKLIYSQSVGGNIIHNNNNNTDSPLSVQLGFPHKSISNGHTPLIPKIPSIPEHKSMMALTAKLPVTPRRDGNESDGTVMTTRSDMTHGPKRGSVSNRLSFPKPKPHKKRIKKRRKRKRDIQKTETDKKYVLSRIYADIDMEEYMTPICWSAIRRLYEDQSVAVKAAFNNNPLSTINIILPRLEKKHIEWTANRQKAREIYRDVATKNSMKALDWQPKYKRLDKTRLSHNEVWRELITAQSILNPEFIPILSGQRQKRSGLKEQQREQFREQYSPMDGSSSIKPTRLIKQHFRPKIINNSSKLIADQFKKRGLMLPPMLNDINITNDNNKDEDEEDDDIDIDIDMKEKEENKSQAIEYMNNRQIGRYGLDFRMNIYYNYGLRFDLKNHAFVSQINLPLTPHEHCWNVTVQYLLTELKSKKIKQHILEDTIRFYSNFIFILFEVDLFHKELLPSEAFKKINTFKNTKSIDNIEHNDKEYVVKFNQLNKLKIIGAGIEPLAFQPLIFDNDLFGEDIDLNNVKNEALMSYHNRLSFVMLCNRDIYNVLRLYIHLWQRLQKARDLSTNRWRLNFDINKKEENNKLQEENEKEFYGKLLECIQGNIKETEFDLIVQQLFGPEGYECANIKYLIKNLCGAIGSIIGFKKYEVINGNSRDNIIWEMIKLWHFYYEKWKEIKPENIKQRIALLRRYYSDIRNILPKGESVVMIEYFLDSKEIGIQYLGEFGDEDDNDGNNDNDMMMDGLKNNGYIDSNSMIRFWQTPIQNEKKHRKHHNNHHHGSNLHAPWMRNIKIPYQKKKTAILEKYRLKKNGKNSKNNNHNSNKKSSSYKRINGYIDNMTMNINQEMIRSLSKRNNRKKPILPSNKHKKDGIFFPLMMSNNNNHNHNHHNDYTSDDSNISKSKRKRRRKKKSNIDYQNGGHSMNGYHGDHNGHLLNGNNNNNHNHNNKNNNNNKQEPEQNDIVTSTCWYHPDSNLYYKSVNISKVKRSKPLHANRIQLSKYHKKIQAFNKWHEQKFKEIQKAPIHSKPTSINNKYMNNNNNNNFSAHSHLNGNHHHHNTNNIFINDRNNNNNNKSLITPNLANNNSNSNSMRSHNNSPYSNTNSLPNTGNIVSSAITSMMPSQSMLQTVNTANKNPSNNTNPLQTSNSIQQFINNNSSINLNGNTASINNLFASNTNTATPGILQQHHHNDNNHNNYNIQQPFNTTKTNTICSINK